MARESKQFLATIYENLDHAARRCACGHRDGADWGDAARGAARDESGGAEAYSGGRHGESQVGEDDARAIGSRALQAYAQHRAKKGWVRGHGRRDRRCADATFALSIPDEERQEGRAPTRRPAFFRMQCYAQL